MSPRGPDIGYVDLVVGKFSTQTPTKIMKTFTQTFVQTLIFNVATIAAVVVGVVQFAVRAYNENNGNEKVREFTLTVLQFVDSLISKFQTQLTVEPEPVVVRKSRKR